VTTPAAAVAPPATILIVDDEPYNRKLLETLLQPEGYATASVASGEEALAAIALRPPDLILLDIMMPGMDGYEVAHRLKASAATSNIPIILVTAQSDDSARLAGLDAGAEDFLTKPVGRTELWLRVRNLLRLKTLGDTLQQHKQRLEHEVQQRVAELQRVEQERFSEAVKQAMILNALPAHIALLDRQGVIVSVNESWRRFGADNECQSNAFGIGLNYLAICDQAQGDDAVEAQQCAAGIRAVLSGERTTFSIEYPCHSPSEHRWFLLTVTALLDGQRAAATVMHVNITALKLSEQALAQESLRNQAFLRNASDGVHILDTEGKVQEVSDSLCAMLGYSRQELIGASVSLWDHQWPIADMQQALARRLVQADRTTFETQHRRKDGTILDVEVSCQRLELNGQAMLFNSTRDVTEKKRAQRATLDYLAQIKTAFMSTVEVVTSLSALRDPYTAGHERRVGAIASAIGAELGLGEHLLKGLRVAGQLHDIGKTGVPSEILSLPGKLSSLQLQLIREHAQAGFDILKVVEFPWPVAQVALQHHERLDGSGYPHGLRGEAILFEARVMAVADVVEAMSSHRPYRSALGIERALTEVERGRGTAYDSTVVDACLCLFRQKNYTIEA
jgi:PAS domain S-box-containing protein